LSRRSRRYLRQSPDRDGKGEHPHRYRVHGSHLLGRCHGRLQATSPTRYRPTLFPPRDHDCRQALARSRAARVARVDDGPARLVLSCRCEPGRASASCAGPSVCSLKEMATMTDNDPTGSTPPGEEPSPVAPARSGRFPARRRSGVSHGDRRGCRRGRLGRSDHRRPARRRGVGVGYRRPAGGPRCGPGWRTAQPTGPGQ
jgi:hypothetical protein